MYGPVRTVVWQGSAGDRRPYADQYGLSSLPQLVVHGDADAGVPVSSSRAMVAEMKRLGVVHQYIDVIGGDHSGVVEPNLAAVFDFFDRHRRRK